MNYKFGAKFASILWLVSIVVIVACVDINAALYMFLATFIFLIGDGMKEVKAEFITKMIALVLLVLAIGLVIKAKMI
ncbi:hypothetical protein [Enterococcus cecorum]|uniref:hypothetical protein n=1 Tax=Enterococcus cecorum TaxID=44008 RepID=UPI002ACA4A08|nr:hypothetical protein [Enterococcus cecorum]MDZ5589930.1 hypothetical protein [Enterococcus cecorum]